MGISSKVRFWFSLLSEKNFLIYKVVVMDVLFDILVKEFNKSSWEKLAKSCRKSKTKVKGIPQEIVDVVSFILGENEAEEWLRRLKIDGKSAIELSKTQNGEKALKAFIMRLPC